MTVYAKVTQKSNHVLKHHTYDLLWENMHLDSYLHTKNTTLENYQL